MPTLRSKVLVLALLCATAHAKKRPMTTPDPIVAKIHALAAALPFQRDRVGQIVELGLGAVPAESSRYFKIYRSDGKASSALFATVELREPTAESAGKGGIVLLDIAPAAGCLKRAAFGEIFGKGTPSGPPHPGAPKSTPRYESFPQPWGTLRLGFHPATGCLAKVVVDAT
jgi:hypothetical protein